MALAGGCPGGRRCEVQEAALADARAALCALQSSVPAQCGSGHGPAEFDTTAASEATVHLPAGEGPAGAAGQRSLGAVRRHSYGL